MLGATMKLSPKTKVGALLMPSIPSIPAVIGIDSTGPVRTSKSQSPPKVNGPVGSDEAATSTPVAIASASMNARPSAPCATLQPYSSRAPPSTKAVPTACRSAVRLARLPRSSVVLPSSSKPGAPWLTTWIAARPLRPASACCICARPSRSGSSRQQAVPAGSASCRACAPSTRASMKTRVETVEDAVMGGTRRPGSRRAGPAVPSDHHEVVGGQRQVGAQVGDEHLGAGAAAVGVVVQLAAVGVVDEVVVAVARRAGGVGDEEGGVERASVAQAGEDGVVQGDGVGHHVVVADAVDVGADGGGVEPEGVAAVAAAENVGAGAAREGVVAAAAGQAVVAGVAAQTVGGAGADHGVVAGAGRDGLEAAQAVAALGAAAGGAGGQVDQLAGAAEGGGVAAGAAGERVVARATV